MKAIALIVNVETGEVLTSPEEGGSDPVADAWALINAVKQDWPECQFAVVADEEAKRAAHNSMLSMLGITPSK